ncbi:MAG TPA: stage II sporulation protein M, partial [Thiotrichales bacterium]|nr:stage II sporulation protein M [Thiotrichales bacterium]
GFRSLISDLALARQTLPDSRLHHRLEALFLAGHQHIYRAPGNSLLRLRDIYTTESPALVRSMAGIITATVILFIVAMLCGWLLIALSPDLITLFVSTEMINRVQAGELWTDGLLNILPSSLLSLQLMTNNITVSIFAFAMGVFYGLGTLYIISLNGLMLGATFAFTAQYRLADELFEFIISHGVVELSVICIAGAMGLKLGEALLRPGPVTRQQAFQQATSDAGKVLLVVTPFLVLAGLIEGYISPDPDYSLAFRLATGVLSGAFFWLFIVFGPGAIVRFFARRH